MINPNEILNEIPSGARAIWCDVTSDADLAALADAALAGNAGIVCADVNYVGRLWTWLEKSSVGVYARVTLTPDSPRARITEENISNLAGELSAAFKHGARGAVVIMRPADLERFVSELVLIRDDLFFNRDLVIAMDISGIEPSSWPSIFANLRRIGASALAAMGPARLNDKSDFIGRIYGMLTAWDTGFNGAVHFAFDRNTDAISAAWRLMSKMRPELNAAARFWIPWG